MPILNSQITDSDNYRINNLQYNRKKSGEIVADYFKYYRQQNLGKDLVSVRRVSAKSLYMNHKIIFDNLFNIFQKYNLNIEMYIKFFVLILGKTEKDIDSDLLSITMIKKFSDRLSIIKQRKTIYSWFMKSANNLADYCLQHDYINSIDGIKDIIQSGKIAQLYISGRLSKYFLVSIPGFNKVIPKLDYFSKCELSEVLNKFDIYRTEINKIFLYLKRFKVNPYKITDDLIIEKRPAYVKAKEIENIFDPYIDENLKK